VQSPKSCVLKYKQDGVLDKNRTMDNVQKHNTCTFLRQPSVVDPKSTYNNTGGVYKFTFIQTHVPTLYLSLSLCTEDCSLSKHKLLPVQYKEKNMLTKTQIYNSSVRTDVFSRICLSIHMAFTVPFRLRVTYKKHLNIVHLSVDALCITVFLVH
jgi:hypothetical protein